MLIARSSRKKAAAAATPVQAQGGMDALVDQPKAEVPTPASPPKETLEPKSESKSGTKLWYVQTPKRELKVRSSLRRLKRLSNTLSLAR